MKTFRIENLIDEEISIILASLISTSDEVMKTGNNEIFHAHASALTKVLHPIVVDEATSLS